MKRLSLLLLALLFLTACGQVAPAEEITTAETTTLTTTEEPTTVFIPTSGESDGVHWRTMDLADEGSAEIRAWLAEWEIENRVEGYAIEQPMGKDKTLVVRYDEQQKLQQLFLKDNKTGKEAFLLDNAGDDEDQQFRHIYVPQPYAINDRYIFVQWFRSGNGVDGCQIFDTREMKFLEFDLLARSLSSTMAFMDVAIRDKYTLYWHEMTYIQDEIHAGRYCVEITLP